MGFVTLGILVFAVDVIPGMLSFGAETTAEGVLIAPTALGVLMLLFVIDPSVVEVVVGLTVFPLVIGGSTADLAVLF